MAASQSCAFTVLLKRCNVGSTIKPSCSDHMVVDIQSVLGLGSQCCVADGANKICLLFPLPHTVNQSLINDDRDMTFHLLTLCKLGSTLQSL